MNRLFAVLVVLIILGGSVFAQDFNFRLQTHMQDIVENKYPMMRKQGIATWALFPKVEGFRNGIGEGIVMFGWFGARNTIWGSADTTVDFSIFKNIKDERRDNLYIEVLLGTRAVTHGLYDLFFQVPVSFAVVYPFHPRYSLMGTETYRYLSVRVNWLPIEKTIVYSSFSLLTDDKFFGIPIQVGFGLDIPYPEETSIFMSLAHTFKKNECESFVVILSGFTKPHWSFRLEVILEDIGY